MAPPDTPELPEVPFGSWPSPITAARLVDGAASVSEVRSDGTDVLWSESRPSEGGRTQIVRRTAAGTTHDVLPAWDPEGGKAWNARTAVQEYGGGAWLAQGRTVWLANWVDQRLYRVDHSSGTPTPISPEPIVARGLRYSELTWLGDGWLLCVRESHEPDAVTGHGEAVNELVAIPADGRAVGDPSLVRVLVTGPDFVHAPAARRTPAVGNEGAAAPPGVPGSGDRATRSGASRADAVAWVEWDHPHMPWDGTRLIRGSLVWGDDGPAAIEDREVVAGADDESIVQPGFLVDGTLVFCTDRTGWWNPWRQPAAGAPVEPVLANGGVAAEVGGPMWVGGLRWWAEIAPGRLAVSARSGGADAVVLVEPDGTWATLDTPFTDLRAQVVAGPSTPGGGRSIVVAGGSPVEEAAPLLLTVLDSPEKELGEPDIALGHGSSVTAPVAIERLRPTRDLGIGPEWMSVPRHVTFPTGPAGRAQAHALVYPPTNPTVRAPAGVRPPLLVMIHGGPTSNARQLLELSKQFWTSRGFAVADVDYRGSTGYGRPFRDLLHGAWGVADVEDAAAAARYLAARGDVDPGRLAIRGGSAGGFTTLAALCFHNTFAAGASHYGVADLAALATETHKFESRYLDGLVGPWPEAEATYAERSPIHHTEGFDRPLLVLQGSEDEVVPPSQAEAIVAALAQKVVPHAYLLFEGEQHGFRQAANIVRALEAELWFYGRVFGFTPADQIAPVDGAVGL